MTILSDKEIRAYAHSDRPIIEPYVSKQVRTTARELTNEELRLLNVDLLRIHGKVIGKADVNDFSSTGPVVFTDNDKYMVSYGIASFGESSYGYDIRLAPEFKLFKNTPGIVFDPKDIREDMFHHIHANDFIIQPNSVALGRTVEYFKMPADVSGLVFPKSTYARIGSMQIPTVIEAGWEGHLVLEIVNMTPFPIKIYANEGIAQVIFLKGEDCEVPYDASRKYFGQTGITLSRI